jgi:hypothetical protein
MKLIDEETHLLGENQKTKCPIMKEANIEILGNTTKAGTEHCTNGIIVKTVLRATKGGDQEKFSGAQIQREGHRAKNHVGSFSEYQAQALDQD